MPSLEDHHSSKLVKVLYLGASSSGKTGSLASLVAAGYKLHILDMDNGVDVLAQYVRRDSPEMLKNVDFETRRDKYKFTATGAILDGSPKAFMGAMELLTKWSDGTSPATWGPDHILVLDTLSAMGRAAFDWARGMNPSAKDPRQWYFTGQKAIEDVLNNLTNESFATNVIVISHVQLVDMPDGSTKGYTNALGKALGPVIPRYFNNVILAETQGAGENMKRKIRTIPTGLIDLKTSAPFKMEKSYDLPTGMATIFAKLLETD